MIDGFRGPSGFLAHDIASCMTPFVAGNNFRSANKNTGCSWMGPLQPVLPLMGGPLDGGTAVLAGLVEDHCTCEEEINIFE
jgi:hypothetical protein